jgi:hypothetical protein
MKMRLAMVVAVAVGVPVGTQPFPIMGPVFRTTCTKQ